IWNYIIILVSILLVSFLLWQETKRQNRQRLSWRVLASIIAVTSLACLALPVSYNKTQDFDASKKIVVLTPGFNEDSLSAFLTKSSNQIPVYTVDESILKSARSFNPTLISDITALHTSTENLATIHIFGYGLGKDQLRQLNSVPIVFHPATIPTGITAISWPRKLVAGNSFSVQGKFTNKSSTDLKLVLRGLGMNLDSAILPKNASNQFELTTIPKHLNRAVYNIFAIAEKDTIEVEEIPFEVIQQKSLQVLLLSSSPDFETKFIKNWLGENGYAVASRSRISKNKFQKEYVNILGFTADHISAAGLDKFDVLIADAKELALINKSELGIIQSQVRNQGLGLIIKTDSSISPASFYAADFITTKEKETNKKEATLSLKNVQGSIIKVPVKDPVYVKGNAGTQSLIKDETSGVFAGSTIFGNGKIVLSTLGNTGFLLLTGQKEKYADIWTLLLNDAAKKINSKAEVTLAPAFAQVNEPAVISIQNNSYLQPAQLGEDKIYLHQNASLPYIHAGMYWPVETGWLPAVDPAGKTDWFYVFNKNSYSTVQAVKKIALTTKHISQYSVAEAKQNLIKQKVAVEVPKIYFFLFFIFASGFLWFEKKLS
ncbi:MAG TPA: hypothetical protein VF623_12815, partial [Segetibacter sp.]